MRVSTYNTYIHTYALTNKSLVFVNINICNFKYQVPIK